VQRFWVRRTLKGACRERIESTAPLGQIKRQKKRGLTSASNTQMRGSRSAASDTETERRISKETAFVANRTSWVFGSTRNGSEEPSRSAISTAVRIAKRTRFAVSQRCGLCLRSLAMMSWARPSGHAQPHQSRPNRAVRTAIARAANETAVSPVVRAGRRFMGCVATSAFAGMGVVPRRSSHAAAKKAAQQTAATASLFHHIYSRLKMSRQRSNNSVLAVFKNSNINISVVTGMAPAILARSIAVCVSISL